MLQQAATSIDELPSRTPAQRLAYLQGRLGALGVDTYWVVAPVNVRYLCGFTGEDSTLLVTTGRTALVTDSRFREQAESEAGVDEIVCRRGGMAAAVGALCRGMGSRRIGISSARVTYANWLSLGQAVAGVQLVPSAHSPVDRMRTRKSREEVHAIAEALAISEAAFRRVSARVVEGMSEKHLAGLLEWEMRQGGADEAAFKTICASAERASLPHAAPTDHRFGPGCPVLVDWGARLRGYNSDLTRMMAVGTMPPSALELAQVVLEAQEAAFDRLAPGVRCCDVDRAARAVIARAGYGRYFGHGLGHGVGLEVHEAPRLGAGEEDILLPGTVVTIEPGIYLPGTAGARIEEMAVITRGGFEALSSLAKRPGGARAE